MINVRGHIDDIGFVSLYWYDADGERTVKTSGDGTVVYVNSLFSGGNTQTAKFTLYVSPYLVASQGGRYTKHIYVGSQRIVSKLGDLQSYGADPRRIPYAGSESDNINVDYKGKYTLQQQSIKNNYAAFDVPYNGKDNDNYADGQGFCCEDIEHDTATLSLNPGQNDNYEQAQFYYHPDHLGSSSFITNLDGDVTQHIEYVPFGEVFIEERNNVWNTPYLFNAKELDEETGLYYYGARYYDSRISLWLSTDPLQEKYPNISSYCYTANNPVKFREIDGNDWIEHNKRYFYDPMVSTPEQTTLKYGKGANYLFASGKLFATDNSYSYNLQIGGHVSNSFTGDIITGEFTTPAGSTIINNNQYFMEHKQTFMEKWSSSKNIFAQFSYNTLNDIYIGVQAFDFGLLDREEWRNPFTGASFGNLDGSPNYNQLDALPGLVGNVVPFGKATKGLTPFKKLNAAQFSKTFKGTLSKLRPSRRGWFNRNLNKGIEKANEYIGSGKIVLTGIESGEAINENIKKKE